jgi:hypothetical protein
MEGWGGRGCTREPEESEIIRKWEDNGNNRSKT